MQPLGCVYMSEKPRAGVSEKTTGMAPKVRLDAAVADRERRDALAGTQPHHGRTRQRRRDRCDEGRPKRAPQTRESRSSSRGRSSAAAARKLDHALNAFGSRRARRWTRSTSAPRPEDSPIASCSAARRALPRSTSATGNSIGGFATIRACAFSNASTSAALPDDAFPRGFDLIAIDTSFISLRTILARAVAYLRRNGVVVALVKPQFEAGRERVGAGGVVRDPQTHRSVLRRVARGGSVARARSGRAGASPLLGTGRKPRVSDGAAPRRRAVRRRTNRGGHRRREATHDGDACDREEGRRALRRTAREHARSIAVRIAADFRASGFEVVEGMRRTRRPRCSSPSVETARCCERLASPSSTTFRLLGINTGRLGFLTELDEDDPRLARSAGAGRARALHGRAHGAAGRV